MLFSPFAAWFAQENPVAGTAKPHLGTKALQVSPECLRQDTSFILLLFPQPGKRLFNPNPMKGIQPWTDRDSPHHFCKFRKSKQAPKICFCFPSSLPITGQQPCHATTLLQQCHSQVMSLFQKNSFKISHHTCDLVLPLLRIFCF